MTHNFLVDKKILQVMEAYCKEGLSKERKNDFHGFYFRGIDDVLNSLSPKLVDAGLIILPNYTEHITEEKSIVLKCTLTIISVEDGTTRNVIGYGEGTDKTDKATSKAMSMLYKYLIIQTFCIPTVGTDESDTHDTTQYVSKDQQAKILSACKENNVNRSRFIELTKFTATSLVPADKFDWVMGVLNGAKE